MFQKHLRIFISKSYMGNYNLIILKFFGVVMIKVSDFSKDSYNIIHIASPFDLEKKAKTLDMFFNVIDTVTDTLSYLSDTVVDTVVAGLSRLFPKRKKHTKKEEELENE